MLHDDTVDDPHVKATEFNETTWRRVGAQAGPRLHALNSEMHGIEFLLEPFLDGAEIVEVEISRRHTSHIPWNLETQDLPPDLPTEWDTQYAMRVCVTDTNGRIHTFWYCFMKVGKTHHTICLAYNRVVLHLVEGGTAEGGKA